MVPTELFLPLFGPFSGPNKVKMDQHYFQRSYMQISRYTVCLFISISDPKIVKMAKNIVFIIFIQKPFYKTGSSVPKKAFWPFLAHFLAKIGQNGPKLFFSWFWSHTISNEGSHAYVLQNSFFGPKRGLFTLIDPLFGPNSSKWPKIIFIVILRPYDFQRGVTCLCFTK